MSKPDPKQPDPTKKPASSHVGAPSPAARHRRLQLPRASKQSRRAKPPKPARGATNILDRFECYERCVQDAERMARFLEAVHGGLASGRKPLTLREDFAGTGGVARAWAKLGDHARAIAVDRDPEPLARLRGAGRVRAIVSDVLKCQVKADILSATNFPIGYWHTRRELITYLRAVRARLKPRGVFVCDTYGGPEAFTIKAVRSKVVVNDLLAIEYAWEQRQADPVTGLVTDVLHFRGLARDKPASKTTGSKTREPRVLFEHRDAFVYHWRLWSIPELRDAVQEAGFRGGLDVYTSLADAVDHEGRIYVKPLAESDHPALGQADYVAYLVARR